ncbi:hypothetical protein [uncultured Roseobacter sp.]|nr:hypothetical protein [uncultured Roseobacter sp.]
MTKTSPRRRRAGGRAARVASRLNPGDEVPKLTKQEYFISVWENYRLFWL